ncbi:unnamed protein product, partial [Cylicocyclus nassatus]
SFLYSITPEHPSYVRSTTENIHQESIKIPTSMLKAINTRKQSDVKENENATAKASNAGASLRQKGKEGGALAFSDSKKYTIKSNTNEAAPMSKHVSKSRRRSSRRASKKRNAKHGKVRRGTKRRQSTKERSRPKSRKSERSKKKTSKKLSLPASKASSSSDHLSIKGTLEEAKTQNTRAKSKGGGSPLQHSAEKTRST